MNIVKRLAIAAGALSIIASSSASATPIIFRLINLEAIGAAFDSVQTYTPSLWLIGSGDLDVGAGTGTFNLPDFVVEVDVLNDAVLDATITTNGWTQTVTSIVGTAISTTGGGTSSCVDEGGLGSFVCPTVSPIVLGWAPEGGSAVIDTILQRITISAAPDVNAGTIVSQYNYTFVPEPGTGMLMSLGLVGLAATRTRKRRG
jgi:hypothetical protein